MRLARVRVDGEVRVAVVQGDQATATLRLLPVGTDLLTAAGGRQEPDDGATTVSLSDVELLAPVEPRSFRDFVSFEQHVEGMVAMHSKPEQALAAWFQQPTYLYGSPHAVIGPDEPVAGLVEDDALDFELEVGVVIGRDGRDLTPEEAGDHIAGYVIVNDWSARAVQRHEMKGGLGPAKSKDFATTVGPWLVTPDELEPARLGDRLHLRMTVSVNGVEFGSDTTAHMGWSFEQLVSHASRGAWVRTGDLIASGTCHGGSLAEAWGRSGRQEPRPLQPGDSVTLVVDRLGSITNSIVAAPPERAPLLPATPLAQLQAATGTPS